MSVALVHALADGPQRYDSLLARLDVSPRALVLALRALQGSGLVEQRVESYALTSAGRGLLQGSGGFAR
jgi:DNA-binding HxlR family transcriptional regulator